MKIRVTAIGALVAFATNANAQTLAQRVTASDGSVQVLFPARPDVCGDGQSYIRMMRGRGDAIVDGDWNARDNRPCVFGQGRLLATVIDGEVTRLNVYVGPVPSNARETRTISATAPDAAAWLVDLAQLSAPRAASRAIQSLMFVDAPTPWPVMLRVARDQSRPREVRQSALLWLGTGVTHKLGLSDVDERASDDDEMRTQAVFVLSQRPKNESVPELIEIVRTAKNRAARKAAIFWLGQSGDPRAADVYAELLGVR